MAAITISRQVGSGSGAIAALVCKELGYRYFDKSLLAKVASEESGSEVDFLKFSEEEFTQGSGLMKRLLTALGRPATAAEIRAWEEDAKGQRTHTVIQLDESRAVALIQTAVRAAAAQGDIIIMGRGGQMILKDQPDVLHVRIEAPLEDRVQRLKTQYNVGRREAEEILFRLEDASTDYVRRFYDVNPADPLLYHLVLNTGLLKPETAAQIIIHAARALQA